MDNVMKYTPTECSYCSEPLNEDEVNHFNIAVNEMPLCSNCLLSSF